MTGSFLVGVSSFPSISFAGERVPVIPFIRHPFKLKMGPKVDNLQNCSTSIIYPIGSIERMKLNAESIDKLVFLPRGADPIRGAISIDKVFIVYDDKSGTLSLCHREGIMSREREVFNKSLWMPVMNDTESLKVVSFEVFREIYKYFVGREPNNGELDIEFILNRKFITPTQLARMNKEYNLLLPYRLWIEGLQVVCS
jgi:hypothetical protein